MSLTLSLSRDEMRTRFFALRSRVDVASLLDIDEKQLVFHVHIDSPSRKYKSFTIPKKSGGLRNITAPISPLKLIQQKLSQVLYCVYSSKPSAHGFVKGRSIVTNARLHVRQRLVLNIDLEDFFPSINFGRVRGMFMAQPYKLNSEVATILAQICCFNNQLPQGAPTSPIISNMICAKMDDQLTRLARESRCVYTRYADDITFSTYRSQFSHEIATISELLEEVGVGQALEQLIQKNGFRINNNKIRLHAAHRRQEVTGLTVNKFPNVKRKFLNQVRAMLHAWRTYGLEAAEREFNARYKHRYKYGYEGSVPFDHVVAGKIEFLGMVRGKGSLVYRRYFDELCLLEPSLAKTKNIEVTHGAPQKVMVMTEGKTDWKHIKAAYLRFKSAGDFQSLDLSFDENRENEMGDEELLAFCKQVSKSPQSQPLPTVCIFDGDNEKMVKEVSEEGKAYKSWGSNVFSFAISVPSHRAGLDGVCIELYYQDKEITQVDGDGRRLFLSTEFDPDSCRLIENPDLSCTELGKIRNRKKPLSIIDNHVFDSSQKNVALPKAKFAENVLNEEPNFDNFDCEEFRKIIENVEKIAESWRTKQ